MRIRRILALPIRSSSLLTKRSGAIKPTKPDFKEHNFQIQV